MPLMSVKARMATRKVIKLSKLHMKVKSSDVQDNDWITVGVIITKSEPKMSSKVKINKWYDRNRFFTAGTNV